MPVKIRTISNPYESADEISASEPTADVRSAAPWTCSSVEETKKRRYKIMKSTGIVRKVDELGRIVLPIELRRTLDIAEKDSIEIYVDGSSIILKKYEPTCVFCGDAKGITVYKGKNVCANCIKELKKI